ncbi:MAG TPA: protein kinase [Gaiellaceae bacterium]|nr:protein kinase [Gaiellaceae bacterium]
MIGELIANRYELQELAGSGGMSSVYRAYDRLLERLVAIKVLHEEYSKNPEYVERFRREAQAIAQLSHPNIVTVIDRGEHEGRQYIVFEHVAGENLKEAVQRLGPLPVGRALALAHQAARGLAFAHQHGVVHRDVKPHNVLIDSEGTAKVTDFGIARSLVREDGITETGTVLGTSDYLAPEQAAGQRVDACSDQYSLGALLYELLVGDVPYPAPNVVTAAMRHMNDPVPSVRAVRPEISPRVDAVIRRTMAKRPEDRYPTTDALIGALEACILEERQEAVVDAGQTEIFQRPGSGLAKPRPGPRRSGARWLAVALGLVLIAAAVSVGVLWTRDGNGLPVVGDDENANAAPVPINAIADYDPPAGGGDGIEHPDEVKRATDGNPSTYWTTERYENFEFKDGVGLVLETTRPVALERLVVRSDTRGFEAVVKAGSEADGPFQDVSESALVGGRTTFELDTGGKEYRYYLFWITSLEGLAHVNEVRAR